MRRIWKYYCLLATCIVSFFPVRADKAPELPGENDDFESIRAQNKLYVDKSDYITALLQSKERFLCMCRPARFGKSNFLQMLNSFFRGQKKSFEGLAIYEKHDWKSSYPVIHLDFGSMNVTETGNFTNNLNSEIVRIGSEYGVKIVEQLPLYPTERQDLDNLPSRVESKLAQLMSHLTENWSKEQSVVILIDEYDYPKRRNSPLYYRYLPVHQVNANLELFLNPFFYELQRMKRFIKFLFFTCTAPVTYHYRTRYPDTPIEIKDITYEDRFSKMIGLTGAELQDRLKPHISAKLVGQPNETFHTLVQKLRRRYDGYCFSPKNVSSESDCRLFNFHSVMTYLRGKEPDYLWHPGAYSKYTVINNVTSMTEAYEIFNIFSNRSRILTISRDSLECPFGAIPFQTADGSSPVRSRFSMRAFLVLYGYLTFHGYNEQTDEFIVDFPNEEMRESYRRSVLRFVAGRETSSADFLATCKIMLHSMKTDSAENLVSLINRELLKPSMGKIDDIHFYYRFSGNRLAHVFGACDGVLQGAMKTKALYREVIHREAVNSSTDGTQGYACDDTNSGVEYVQKYVCDVLVVRVPGGITYTFKVDVERSAASAMNEALKSVNTEDFREASRNETFYLMGINFDSEEGLIEDWIRMTYKKGKFEQVVASNPRNSKMYLAYANQLEPFSPLL